MDDAPQAWRDGDDGRLSEAGSLKRVENIAREMPSIRLGDALRIVALMARDGDPRYERAARRWLERLAAETDLDPAAARACLRRLPSQPDAIDDLRHAGLVVGYSFERGGSIDWRFQLGGKRCDLLDFQVHKFDRVRCPGER